MSFSGLIASGQLQPEAAVLVAFEKKKTERYTNKKKDSVNVEPFVCFSIQSAVLFSGVK